MTTAAEYRIEHVAQTPSGYHVRTMAPGPRSDHLIRVAFPPGRRRRGSGQLVEILHPPGENPCRFNPESHRILWLDEMVRRLVEDYRGWRRAGMSHDDALKETLSRTTAGPAAVAELRKRIAANPSQFERQRGARDRASRIRGARLNPDAPTLYDAIRHGDRVTIVNRFGQQRTGRAVMLGPAGWVLNMGGPHGTPAIASPENITRVRSSNPEEKPKPRKGESVPEFHARRVREILAKMPRPIREVFDRNPASYKFVFRNAQNPTAETLEWARNELRRVLDHISVTSAAKLLRGKSVRPHAGETLEKLEWSKNQLLRVLDHVPAEQAIKLLRRDNPDGELDEAAALYEEFHGREPSEIVRIQESAEQRGEYTALGDLVELIMVAPNGDEVLVKFKSDGVRVASSPSGEQLYLLGGNQDISGHLRMFGADEGKDLIDLGEAKRIVYEAAKWQTDFTPQEWKHDFGEESGTRPRAFYDQLKRRIFFAGGNYKVKRPGIVD